MEHLAGLFGALTSRRHRRSRLRRRDEEQLAAAPAGPARERGLDGYIPSSLVPTDERVRAMIIGGAPAWSRRLKRIDTLTDAALENLEAAWRELAAKRRRHPERFAVEWHDHAARADFARVNDLIARHNLHFPTEARLRMDVHTRDFVGPNGGDYRRRPLDAAWVLERFPPDLTAALE